MLRRFLLTVVGVAACALLTVQSATAQGKGKGHGQGQAQSDRPAVSIVFGVHDREIISKYFRNQYSNLPPGLAKRNGNLPPGLQKQLERNGTLPPGLQKRLTSFPADLERQLPRLPDIYRRATIGTIAVILDRRTQRIMDVIRDVLNP